MTSSYSLFIEFPLTSDFSFITKDIEKTISKTRDGSGGGFGTRDLEFYYTDKKSAKNDVLKVKQVLKKYFKVKDCTIIVQEYKDV